MTKAERKRIGRKGGLARARKYSHAQLSRMAKRAARKRRR
jgi:hypothetical protein